MGALFDLLYGVFLLPRLAGGFPLLKFPPCNAASALGYAAN